MNANECEIVQKSAMALADGENSIISAEQIEAHLEQCLNCSHEVTELKSLIQLMDAQKRKSVAVDLWAGIGRDLKIRQANLMRAQPPQVKQDIRSSSSLWWTGTLGLLAQLLFVLLSIQFLILTTSRTTGMIVRLSVLALFVFCFIGRRENPFTINTELAARSKELNL